MLVTPRWLATTVFVVLAFVTAMALGAWQWDRAHQKPRAISIEDERVVPLADVLEQPADLPFPSGLLVRGSGRYATGGFVAQGVDAAGRAQAWAVSPLDLAGREVAVVRGAAKPVPSAPVPDEVVVTGRLQPPAVVTGSGGLTAVELAARGVDPRGYLVLTANNLPHDSGGPKLREAVLSIGRPPASVHEYYRQWFAGDGFPLWAFWENVRTWWEIRELPNVLLVHFESLKRDMPAGMRRMHRIWRNRY